MSPHQTIAVAVRLFAVWLALYVGSTSLSFFAQPGGSDTHVANWVLLLALGVAGAVILALWLFPLTIARKLLTPPAAPPAAAASPDTWLLLGCVLIGLWTLSHALPALVADGVASYFYGSDYIKSGPGLARIIYRLLELAFAAWLVLGASGIRRIFWWARNAGISRSL